MSEELCTHVPGKTSPAVSLDTSTGDATIEAIATPAGSDHRSHSRFCGGTITLTRVSLAGVEASYFAWVHDISGSGIGLDMLGPLGAGVDIVFELKGSGENDKIRLYAQVVHATQVGPFFRLGCRFTMPLRPSVLATIMHRIRGV